MNRMYKESKIGFSIIMILLYFTLSFILRTSFKIDAIPTLIGYSILLFMILKFIYNNKLNKYYGLLNIKNTRKYLYFIPLFTVCFYNLYNAILIANYNMFIYIINMIICSILEVIIYYGFLYKSISKNNNKRYIIIVSILFSIKELIKILNGMDPIYSILNMISISIIVYMGICLFNKSKSIIPCIISNSILSCFSIYTFPSYKVAIISTILVIIISISYSIFLEKKC